MALLAVLRLARGPRVALSRPRRLLGARRGASRVFLHAARLKTGDRPPFPIRDTPRESARGFAQRKMGSVPGFQSCQIAFSVKPSSAKSPARKCASFAQ